jgi:hypothetical protein
MLGEEGRGFELMMTKLAQERLAQAIRSATVTETVVEWTVDYVPTARPSARPSATSRTPSSSSPSSRPRRWWAVSSPTNASRVSCRASSIRSTRRWPRCGVEHALQDRRRVPAAVRRLGLHVGISDRAGLCRCAHREDRGRLDRDHEDTSSRARCSRASSRRAGADRSWHEVRKIPEQFLLKIYQSGLAVMVQTNTKDLL